MEATLQGLDAMISESANQTSMSAYNTMVNWKGCTTVEELLPNASIEWDMEAYAAKEGLQRLEPSVQRPEEEGRGGHQ